MARIAAQAVTGPQSERRMPSQKPSLGSSCFQSPCSRSCDTTHPVLRLGAWLEDLDNTNPVYHVAMRMTSPEVLHAYWCHSMSAYGGV